MLYLISLLLAAIAVLLILINAKLKLTLQWLRSIDSQRETLTKISQTLYTMVQLDKKP